MYLLLFFFPLLQQVDHRGSCCDLCHRVFCLCFPVRVLYFFGLTFRSLIHFEFIFVYGVRKCSCFIHSFTCSWPLFLASLVEGIIFSPWYFFASFVKDKVSIGVWISCIYFQSVRKSLVLIIISELKPESLHCYKWKQIDQRCYGKFYILQVPQ